MADDRVGTLRFEEWYASERPRVLATLAVLCGDLDAAHEATDEAFARAYSRWDRVATMVSPGGWVYRVALNDLRRRRRRGAVERRLLNRLRPLPEARLPSATYEMWALVAELPARQATAVALRYLGGLSEADVAAAM